MFSFLFQLFEPSEKNRIWNISKLIINPFNPHEIMSLQPCMRIRAAIILITEKRLTTTMMALAMAVKVIVHQDEPCLWHLACAGDRHSDGFSIGHNNPNMDSAGWKFWTWGRKMVRVSLVVVSWWLHYFYDVARMVLKEIWEDMALAVLALKGVSVTLGSLVIQPICSAYTTGPASIWFQTLWKL